MRVEVVGGVHFVSDDLLPRWFRGARFRAEGECYSRVGRTALVLGCRPTTTTAIVTMPVPPVYIIIAGVVGGVVAAYTFKQVRLSRYIFRERCGSRVWVSSSLSTIPSLPLSSTHCEKVVD